MKIKNILIIALALFVLFTAAGCSDDSQKSDTSQNKEISKQIYNEQRKQGIDIKQLNDVKNDTSKIYEANYQKDKKTQIETLKKKRKYTMKPLWNNIQRVIYLFSNEKGEKF